MKKKKKKQKTKIQNSKRYYWPVVVVLRSAYIKNPDRYFKSYDRDFRVPDLYGGGYKSQIVVVVVELRDLSPAVAADARAQWPPGASRRRSPSVYIHDGPV